MATVDATRTKPRRKREQPPLKKSRAFRYGSLFTLVMLAVAVGFAPAIIASTPLASWAVATTLELEGSVSVGSVSLGWFSPVAVEKLEIFDAAGEKVLELPAFRTDKILLSLLFDSADLGTVYVDQPGIHVVAAAADTNLERVFARLLKRKGGSHVAAQVELTDGTIVVDDEPSARQFKIEKLSLSCAVDSSGELTMLRTTGTVTDGNESGQFAIDAQFKPDSGGSSNLANGKVHCETSTVPLWTCDPVLRRLASGARVSGELSTKLDGAWGEFSKAGDASLAGQSRLTNLVFMAARLGDDRIELSSVDVPCQIVQTGDDLTVERLGIECELGQLSISGKAKMADLAAKDLLLTLLHESYRVEGKLDLAQVARRLPNTLRIREGTQITSGELNLELASATGDGQFSWTGRLETERLVGEAEGRTIEWKNPFVLDFTCHDTKGGLAVDRAHCSSSFLELDGAGTLDDFSCSGRFDLARLTSELRQFSDLAGAQLAGQGELQLACKRPAADRFEAEGTFATRAFRYSLGSGHFWAEDNLSAKLSLGGQIQDSSFKRLERGELTVDAGDEELQARLSEGVNDPAATPWPIQVSWRGQLAAWTPRLAVGLGVPGLDLAGTGAVQAALLCSSKAIEVTQANAEIAQLRAWGRGWFVSEPECALSANAKWDRARTRLEIAQARCTAGASLATIEQASLQATSNGWMADGGDIQFAGDLAQWYRWRHDPRAAADLQVAGRIRGAARVKEESGTTAAQVEASIEQLQVAQAAQASNAASVWREQQLTLVAQARYEQASSKLQLDKAELSASALACAAAGLIALADQGGQVDLKGNLSYDWGRLSPLWQSYLGRDVRIEGKQTRPFAIHGQLSGPIADARSWNSVTADAGVGWTAMNVAGLDVGPGDVKAHLSESRLQAEPLDVHVSEGRFTFAPVVRLNPAPMELLLSGGPLLTDVHLTPEICARGLKFVAPILAESTVADGHFSITLDGGHVPISDPGAGDASGRMAMRAQVKAGPVAQEFMVLVNELSSIIRRGVLAQRDDQSGALVSIDSQEVQFRLVNGRIYHRGLKFQVGTMPVTTHGSVGTDESLAIVAEIPLQATLFGRDLSLGAFEGRAVQIPIGGTLGKPKLDRGALQQFAAGLIGNTARGVLLDGINKRLEQLLPLNQ